MRIAAKMQGKYFLYISPNFHMLIQFRAIESEEKDCLRNGNPFLFAMHPETLNETYVPAPQTQT